MHEEAKQSRANKILTLFLKAHWPRTLKPCNSQAAHSPHRWKDSQSLLCQWLGKEKHPLRVFVCVRAGRSSTTDELIDSGIPMECNRHTVLIEEVAPSPQSWLHYTHERITTGLSLAVPIDTASVVRRDHTFENIP